MSARFPDDRLYHSEALWLCLIAGSGEALVGLSHYAQERLGQIVYVDLPALGSKLKAGAPFGTIESSKAASDLIAPASGKVIACNGDLAQNPGVVNADCYQGGWLVRITLEDAAADGELLSAEEYMRRIGIL